jgi:hypothetical protein
MKAPLEPIPKETALLVKQAASGSGNNADDSAFARLSSYQADKVYPWLLGVSITISAVLCWLYVTKPVILISDSSSPGQSQAMVSNKDSAKGLLNGSEAGRSSHGKAALVPSDNGLPESSSAMNHSADSTSLAHLPHNGQSPHTRNPAMLAKSHAGAIGSPFFLGWESTNLKVQHILSVDAGGGELEKIVLNVPVLYQTRTLRWTAEDITKARSVMTRLMEYERNLNQLRGEAQSILKDWNQILQTTAPTVALRADSPTLPYNHGNSSEPESLPDSSSAIKLEQ